MQAVCWGAQLRCISLPSAQGCQGMPHIPRKPLGWSQPAQQVSSGSDHVMRARSPLECRNTQLLMWLGQRCQDVPPCLSKPVDWSQPAQQVSSAADLVLRTRSTKGRSVQAVCWGAQAHCISLPPSPKLSGDAS